MDKITKIFVGEVKEINEKDNTLVAIVSTGAVDRMGEVVEPDGIDLKNYRKNPVVLWAHDYRQPPIGKALWIKKQDGAVISKMQFANTPKGQEVFQLYKEGILRAFSIGFVPVEKEPMKKDDTSWFAPQRYKKSELLEYSAVPVPANPEALTLAMSKGLLDDVALKKEFDDFHPDELETVPRAEAVYKASQVINTENNDEDVRVKELEGQIEKLSEAVDQYKTENDELRLKLFKIHNLYQQKLSEITVDKLATKFSEVLSGVIRRAQGAVD